PQLLPERSEALPREARNGSRPKVKEPPMSKQTTPQCLIERARSVTASVAQGERLRVVPILGSSADEPPYELLRPETVSKVKISEVSESGSVPELRVENELDVRVFLMDGQEL